MARDLNIGLVLREDLLEWTSVQRARSGATPSDSGTVELPMPAPDLGEEERKALESERAAKLKTACHKLGGFVAATLPSDQVLLKVVELPTIVDAELGDMIALQVDKFSPFPLESLTVSYEVLVRKSESTVVLLAACQIPVVDRLEQALTTAGVLPSRMDVAVLGWCRLLKDAGEIPEKGRHLVVILDDGAPEIVIFEDGVPKAFRPMPGLETLSGEELESELVSEINGSLLSIEIEQGEGVDGGITLYHADEEPSTLGVRLSNALGRKVSLKSLARLPMLSEGIARRTLSRTGIVDLTTPTWRAAEQARLSKKRVIFALLGLVVLWLLCIGGLEGWIMFQRIKLGKLAARRDELSGPAERVLEMRRRVLMVQRYTNKGDTALEAFREICTLQPVGVELTAYTYRKEEDPKAPGGGGTVSLVKISGEAPSVSLIYDFKTALDGSRMFREATLQGPRVEARSGRQLFDIDLKMASVDVKATGAAP